MDLYINENDCVFIVDFGPFCETTDSLFFSWNEIHDIIQKNEASLSLDDNDNNNNDRRRLNVKKY